MKQLLIKNNLLKNGDVDQDGAVTIKDITQIIQYCQDDDTALNSLQRGIADVNYDDTINMYDVQCLFNMANCIQLNKDSQNNPVYYQTGDVNLDGNVDSKDYTLLYAKYASHQRTSKFDEVYDIYICDINKDNAFTYEDLNVLSKMINIPYTYSLNTSKKTMTITGVKDTSIEQAYIQPTYQINGVTYTVTTIADNAFTPCTNLKDVYIPATVTTIGATKTKYSPFYNANPANMDLHIYCEAKTAPAGWGDNWYVSTSYVTYGYTIKNIGDCYDYTADTTNKTLTITGTKTHNSTEDIQDWYMLNGEIYRVTSIGEDAFYGCTSITDVYLPWTLESIGSWAFADAEYLQSAEMSNCINLNTIHDNAFTLCDRLDTVTLPENGKLQTIEYGAFSDNPDLEEITIPSSVQNMQEDVFTNCNNITIYCKASKPGTNWNKTWNYINSTTMAPTYFNGVKYVKTFDIGDTNKDGNFTLEDFKIISNIVYGNGSYSSEVTSLADITKDGNVDYDDLLIFIDKYLNTSSAKWGDIDCDGKFTERDYDLMYELVSSYLYQDGRFSDEMIDRADFNKDGSIFFDDIDEFEDACKGSDWYLY